LTNLLTIADICDYLQITRTTALKWVADGKLPPPIRLGVKTHRWRFQEIEGALEKLSQ
jgi:excisionase family DNA binding protein